jgi:hypothetical protein
MSSLLASLGGYFLSKKDDALSAVLRPLAQYYCKEYGEMLNLSVNSQEKTLRVELLLKGETAPITITVENYELVTEDGATALRLKGLSVSREWLDALAKTLFPADHCIALPNEAAALLKFAL